jgi:hypothetical protein
MADEPQDPTEDPDEAANASAEGDAVEEPSPSGEADDDTSAAGGEEGTGPDVAQDEQGVAEATDHSTQLSESETPDPISPGQPRGIDPKTLDDRDPGPQL